MIKPVTLALCFIVALRGEPALGQNSDEANKLLSVRGYLNAHWEYPHFIPDRGSGFKVMDFLIREEKWQNLYSKPVYNAMRFDPDKTICFRVIGKGFIKPRRPDFMQPWDGNAFIFVKIEKMKQLSSDKECTRER